MANGAVLRMTAEGANLEAYAWGLRNPFGVMWGPDGRLYASDNGCDERGSRPIGNAPDHVFEIKHGAWYGWPDYVGGAPVTDRRFRPKHGAHPQFLMAEHPRVEKPLSVLPVHAGATKMDFSTSDDFGHRGQMFLALFGDVTPLTGRGAPVPPQVLRIDPSTGAAHPFFRTASFALGPAGMEHVVTAGARRLLDVRFSPDGSAMYVVDFGAYAVLPLAVPLAQPFEGTGVVWRITRDGAATPPYGRPLSARPGEPPAERRR
jgi:glucose/arabinose dehydrogenase